MAGCAETPVSSRYGPPRYGQMENASYPRLVRFKESATAPWQAGLWLGTEKSSGRPVGVVLPLGKRDFPTPNDWQGYEKIVRVYDQINIQRSAETDDIEKNIKTAKKIPVSDIVSQKLLGVPFPAKRIICVAFNHTDHMRDFGLSDKDIEKFKKDPPRFFWKKTDPVGPFDTIQYPVKNTFTPHRSNAVYLDYEVELGLVIGKTTEKGQITDQTKLQDILAGIVLANDISDREPQIWSRTNPGQSDEGTAHWPLTGISRLWNRQSFDYFIEAKSQPTFAVLGPFLVGPEKYSEIYAGSLELWRKQGGKQNAIFERKQNGLVINFLHNPLHLIKTALEDPYLDIQALEPGDVILIGTPGGTIFKSSDLANLIPKEFVYTLYQSLANTIPYLKPGDQIWAETDMLGFQWNEIEAPQSSE